VVFENGEPTLQGNIGLASRKFVPLHMMGEGMSRLASVVMTIATTKNGVVFVDDFDSGLHYSCLPQVWRSIRKALELFNVQLFATTHRSESVSAAHDVFADVDEKVFLTHRLELSASGVTALTYDKEALEGALEAGLEVR
jgi:AAA15 family ATPase/GTPase